MLRIFEVFWTAAERPNQAMQRRDTDELMFIGYQLIVAEVIPVADLEPR